MNNIRLSEFVSVENGTELLGKCPECRKRKLYIDSKTYCGICFYCGKAFSPREILAGNEIEAKPSYIPNQNRTLHCPNLVGASNHPDAQKLFQEKGVKNPGDSRLWYDLRSNRLYFNIISPCPSLLPGFHTRAITGGWMCQPGIQKSKYWFSNYIPGSKRVVLVEGIFDALSIGENAIALLGTILSDIHLYGLKEMKVKEILVWMDDDEAGRKAQKKIVDKLTDNGFEVSVVEGKAEPSECGECEEKEWARCSV